MSLWVDLRRNGRWIEWALMLVVLFGFLRMAWLTIILGYFPQPFFYDTDDTWRDWFSTAIWAHERGAYDSWLSIYPPLSFAFLKVVGVPSCYDYAPLTTVRDCDWVGVAVIHLLYVINAILTSIAFIKIDRRTALPRAFAITAGMPMIFGLERGNLVLLCFTFLLLGYGPLLRSARLRWICIGIAVNLKVYLISGVVVHLLRRKWLWVEGVLIAIIVIYLISYGLYGDGTPKQIYDNIVNFATGATPNSILDIWYPNTYIPLHYVLAESDAPVNLFIGSREVNLALLAIPTAVHGAQLIIVLAAVATWLRPEVVPPFRVTFFGLALAMITSETSAYTQPMMFLFVFMESWKGWARPLAIATCYILCIPGDIMISQSAPMLSFSFIAGHFVWADRNLTLGMFLRPLLFMLPAYFLGLKTIRDVWLDIRFQGWKDRWRFRHDWPLLPGILRPRPPANIEAT